MSRFFSFCVVDMYWNRQDIIEALAEATERGVIIVTCTQCSSGAVSEDDDDIDVDDDIDDIDDDDIDDDDNDGLLLISVCLPLKESIAMIMVIMRRIT